MQSKKERKTCKGNVTNLFVFQCQMLFTTLTLFSNLFRGEKKEKLKQKYCIFDGKQRIVFPSQWSAAHTTMKIYARFLFTKSGCNKLFFFSIFLFSSSRFCVDSHITLPDCTYLCIYNLRAEITIIFEHNFAFVFRTRWVEKNCARQTRSSMHEFLMHFSRLFSSFAHIQHGVLVVEMHWKFPFT
jgi:hypothetical protein